MLIERDERNKIISIWMQQGEEMTEYTDLDSLCKQCEKMHYTVAVFRSGTQNVKEQTRALLKHHQRIQANHRSFL